jgi:hypothetical protein
MNPQDCREKSLCSFFIAQWQLTCLLCSFCMMQAEREVLVMLGAIFGDISGSVYEFANTHRYDFELLRKDSVPTDDTYMTVK